MTTTMNVLYAEPLPDALRQIVRDALPEGWTLRVVASTDRAELLQYLPDADFVVVATTRVDQEAISVTRRLKHVQHQGVGYDNIDVAACRSRGISVALTPEGTTIGVAEHTFLLLLALYKHLRDAEGQLRAGGWPVWELRSSSFEIAGKTIGLIGFGRIGQAVARRAAAFDAKVRYFDPFPPPAAVADALGAAYRPLDDVLGESDVVSLHLPLSPETRGTIGARELRLMARHAVLINTARGPLVDEPVLIQALREGWIAGAGLDVFEKEPPAPDNPLLQLANVVVTPHISAGTVDAFRTKMGAVAANLLRVSQGVAPANAVAP